MAQMGIATRTRNFGPLDPECGVFVVDNMQGVDRLGKTWPARTGIIFVLGAE